MTRIVFFIALILLAAGAQPAAFASGQNALERFNEPSGPDWPRWQGPAGTGVSPETGWSPAALNPRAAIAAKRTVGLGFGSVAIRGGRLYTVGNSGANEVLHCVEIASGRTVWQHLYPAPRRMDWPGADATPCLDGDHVYVLGRGGLIICLKAADGKIVWQKDAQADFGARMPTWGFASSPVVKGDVLYLAIGRAGAALNKRTGAKIWSSDPGICGYASPVFYKAQGKERVLFFSQTALHGVDQASGKVLWSHTWVTSYDVNAADPRVIDNRLVFISSNYGKGCALLDISGDKPAVLWTNANLRSHFSSVIHIGGFLYGNDAEAHRNRGSFRCLELKSGQLKWSQDLGAGSLLQVGDKLILLNENGRAAVIDPNPSAYKEISSFSFPRGLFWTPPVFCRGFLFVRDYHKGDIYCVDLKK